MSSSPQFSYADAFGIDSLGAPILFAVLYALCVGAFAFKSLRNPTFILFVLTLFCASESYHTTTSPLWIDFPQSELPLSPFELPWLDQRRPDVA